MSVELLRALFVELAAMWLWGLILSVPQLWVPQQLAVRMQRVLEQREQQVLAR